MSKDMIDVLLQFGPFAVLIIAAGAIVAAMIGAANAWAVAVFNARATRQLAIDTAHREFRREWCADTVREAQLLDGLAPYLVQTLGESKDAGIPFSEDDARRVMAYARDYATKLAPPNFRRPLPPDALFERAYKQAERAEQRLDAALRALEQALARTPLWDLSPQRRELVIAAHDVARSVAVLQSAAECFIFNLGRGDRRRIDRQLRETK